MHYELAPLAGVTTFVYRQAHQAQFGGAEKYFTPFFVPTQERKLSTKERRDLDPAHNDVSTTIPQVLTKKAEDVLWAAQEMAQLGYSSLNVNLGCPAGTVVSKGKGSGMLGDVDGLDAFLAQIFAQSPLPISIKTRIGLKSPEEFPAILAVFNRYPIERLTIHPRVQKDYYKLPVRPEWFDYALEHTALPLTYNGDLYTLADLAQAQNRWPSVDTFMLGRGLIGNPALLRKVQGGPPATREELQAFTATLHQGYLDAFGDPGSAAQRMKEVWFYMIHLFNDNHALDKKMRRSSTPYQFLQAQNEIFQTLALNTTADASALPLD